MNHDNPCGEVADLYRDRWPTYEAAAQKTSKVFGESLAIYKKRIALETEVLNNFLHSAHARIEAT